MLCNLFMLSIIRAIGLFHALIIIALLQRNLYLFILEYLKTLRLITYIMYKGFKKMVDDSNNLEKTQKYTLDLTQEEYKHIEFFVLANREMQRIYNNHKKEG